MDLNERQRAILGDAVRHGGMILIPRELAGSSSLYLSELMALERKGLLSAPEPSGQNGPLRCAVTANGKNLFARGVQRKAA